jgi:short-subunit dehydrogenase
LEINTLGPIQVTEEILPLFRKNNKGWIFNVISSAAHVESDVAFSKAYAASKWGLEGYAKALRDDLKNTKIYVSDFLPGGFDSMLYEKAKRNNPHNQPWMMKTDDVADIAVFMLTRPENMLIKQIIVGTI